MKGVVYASMLALPELMDEVVEPSIESSIPEERIEARRLRLQKKLEAEERAQKGEVPIVVTVKADIRFSHQQIQLSGKKLSKLISDTNDLVTNVQVVTDSRENQLRSEKAAAINKRQEIIQQELKYSLEKYFEISENWELILQKQISSDILEKFKHQKELCDELIAYKKGIIEEMSLELPVKEDEYVKALGKYGDDINLLIVSMDNQLSLLVKSYQGELVKIENMFLIERTQLLDANKTQWQELLQKRADLEVEYLIKAQEKYEEYQMLQQRERIKNIDGYNQVKVRLESEIELLQQQFEGMKATCILNQEKLDYNVQVLKKRDEENSLTKTSQKRKLTKQMDVANNLRQKLSKAEKQFREEYHQLTEDCEKFTQDLKLIQGKAKHLQSVAVKKFYDMWIMTEEEVKLLIYKLLKLDKLISEQQLGLSFKEPDISFMKNYGPVLGGHDRMMKEKMATNASKLGLHLIIESTSKEDLTDDALNIVSSKTKTKSTSPSMTQSKCLLKFSKKTTKRLLEMLGDEMGYLAEDKLLKLVSNLEKHHENLIKLDSVLLALGIDTVEDIYLLSSHLLRQRDKPVTSSESRGELRKRKVISSDQSIDLRKSHTPPDLIDKRKPLYSPDFMEKVRSTPPPYDINEKRKYDSSDRRTASPLDKHKVMQTPIIESTSAEPIRRTSTSVSIKRSFTPAQSPPELLEEETAGSFDDDGPLTPEEINSLTMANHYGDEFIHPNEIKTVLQDYLEIYHQQEEIGKTLPFKLVFEKERDKTEDARHWQKYATFHEEKLPIWNTLLKGFQKYNHVLKERDNLLNDVATIKRQNAQLSRILQSHY